jgi:hypothetical protein
LGKHQILEFLVQERALYVVGVLQNMVGIYLQEFPNGKRTNGVGKDLRMLDQAEKVSL